MKYGCTTHIAKLRVNHSISYNFFIKKYID